MGLNFAPCDQALGAAIRIAAGIDQTLDSVVVVPTKGGPHFCRVEVNGPQRHQLCQTAKCCQRSQGSRPMTITRIGLDMSKHVFRYTVSTSARSRFCAGNCARREIEKFFNKRV